MLTIRRKVLISMEKTVERKENLEVVINLKFNGDEWKKAWKKEHNKRAANIVVPGFRKGKAPASMVNARINHGQVLSDTLFNLANKGFQEAVNENKLYVFSEPKLSINNGLPTSAPSKPTSYTVPETGEGIPVPSGTP